MENNDIVFSDKFQPLFELLEGEHEEVDLVIVTGGRLGSKSFGVSTFAAEGFIQEDWQILYSRFTNVSGQDSTVPEFAEKLEMLGYQNHAKTTNNRIESLCGDGKVVFKGLKASSNAQSANLKGLKDFNCWINDESEEVPSYDTFKKIYLSIRSLVKRNVTILILNPTVRDFWIHDKFFKPKQIPDLFNGIVDNVMYIHTTYLDVPEQYVPDNILRDYDYLKNNYPDEYYHVILGGWLSDVEGALYQKSELARFSLSNYNNENKEYTVGAIDVADRGTDSLSFPICEIIDDRIYITDWYFTTDNTEVTIPTACNLTNTNKLDFLAIETNNMGQAYLNNVSEGVIPTVDIIPIWQKANKHSRIISKAHFIRKYVVFRDDYVAGSDYDKAMKELFMYTKDGKSKHDDAIDALTLLVSVCLDIAPEKWFNN